jgi:thiosulfate/3-mercaptopyruvate sulfurtransferase
MRRLGWIVALSICGGIADAQNVTEAGAAAPRASSELLVSFDELEKLLDRLDVRILDVRPENDYKRGHVVNAVWVDLKPFQAQASMPGGLTDAAKWQELIAPLGIQPGQRVVIYDGKRQLEAARLWWLLGYLGLDGVSLLDGNYALWARENRRTATVGKDVESSTFEVKLREDRLASRDEVLSAIKSGDHAIVDARSAKEFSGEQAMSKRGGHVPGAKNVEWTDLIDSDGRFLSLDTIRAKMRAAGVDPRKPAITHCQGGGRSSVNAFVLERLGVPTQNYYLGWSEWGNDEACPIESSDKSPATESPK